MAARMSRLWRIAYAPRYAQRLQLVGLSNIEEDHGNRVPANGTRVLKADGLRLGRLPHLLCKSGACIVTWLLEQYKDFALGVAVTLWVWVLLQSRDRRLPHANTLASANG